MEMKEDLDNEILKKINFYIININYYIIVDIISG